MHEATPAIPTAPASAAPGPPRIGPRGRPAALGFIYAAVMMNTISMGVIAPVFPVLVKGLTGQGDAGAAVIMGVFGAVWALMQLIFAPIFGNLSDRFGRRPVLLVSLAGAAVDYLLMAGAPTLGWLYVGRVVAGITGASAAVATAYVTDVTPQDDRANRYGQMGAVMGLGFIAGPVLGGLLGEWHLRAPFVAAAIVNAINFGMAVFVLPESRPARADAVRERPNLNAFAALHRLDGTPALLPLAGVFAVIVLASQAPATLWILYGQDRFGWSTMVAGLSLAGFGVCHAVVQAAVTGPVVARLGERAALLAALGVDGAAMLLMAVATRGWMPFALVPLFAIGGMSVPALQATLSAQVDESRQGELQGTLASIASLIGVAGPLVATAAFAATRAAWPGAVWASSAALYLLVLPLLFNARVRSVYAASGRVAEAA